MIATVLGAVVAATALLLGSVWIIMLVSLCARAVYQQKREFLERMVRRDAAAWEFEKVQNKRKGEVN